MFSQLKLYLYSAVGLVIAGLYAMLKYKSARLEAAQEKIEKAKATIKAKTFEAKMKDNKSEAQHPPDFVNKPGKYSLALLPLLFVFIGCSEKQVQCPKLEKVEHVKPINFEIDNSYCVCGEGLSNLVKGTMQLRKSEAFYETEVDSYNKEFASER